MLHYKVLDPSLRVPFELLLKQTWQQNWFGPLAEQIVDWRYFDRPPGSLTWVAMEDDACVGMIDSMVRPYLLDGQRIMVRETADWYCAPAYRKFGVGLWLLRKLQIYPEPVFMHRRLALYFRHTSQMALDAIAVSEQLRLSPEIARTGRQSDSAALVDA